MQQVYIVYIYNFNFQNPNYIRKVNQKSILFSKTLFT